MSYFIKINIRRKFFDYVKNDYFAHICVSEIRDHDDISINYY